MVSIDFVIAGFAKCGTTTLYHYLKQHPQLFLTTPKETNHFIRPDINHYWSKYDNLFTSAQPHQLLGEGSVSYAESEFADFAINRLKHFNPGLKLIFIVRDPAKRIESQFRELHDSGFKLMLSCPFDLSEALVKIPNMLSDTHYERILNLYLTRFDSENMHVIFLEDLIANPKLVLQSVLDFLAVPQRDFVFEKPTQSNAGRFKYRDTELFRRLRNARGVGLPRHLPFELRERISRSRGWRIPFASEPVVWSDAAKSLFYTSLVEHSEALLSRFSRERLLWPLYESIFNWGNTQLEHSAIGDELSK